MLFHIKQSTMGYRKSAPADSAVRLVDIIYTFPSHMFSFSHLSLYFCSLFFFFFLGGVKVLLVVEGVPSAVSCECVSLLYFVIKPSISFSVPKPNLSAMVCQL